MSATFSFEEYEDTPSWAMQPPASFRLVQDSEFPPLGPAASKHSNQSKPLTVATVATVATHKRPVAQPEKDYRNQNTHKKHEKQPQQPQYTQRPRECKVCIDAGKTEEECTSHYVKDRFGNVTCPTLLNQKCLSCGTVGHTTSYCKARVVISKPPIAAPALNNTKQVVRPMCSNKYALLAIVEQCEPEPKPEPESVPAFAQLSFFAAYPPLEKKPDIARPTHTPNPAPNPAPILNLSTWASRINSPPPSPSQQDIQEPQQQQQKRKPTKPKKIAVCWGDR